MSLQYDTSGKLIDGTQQMQYNGSTYDVVQNNTQGTLLASAARTTSVTSPNQTNYNARGVLLTLNVTGVSGTSPTLILQINIVDPVTGIAIAYSSVSSNIIANGNYTYLLYPSNLSAGISGNIGIYQAPLPRQWQVTFAISGTTPSFTFSCGYALIL